MPSIYEGLLSLGATGVSSTPRGNQTGYLTGFLRRFLQSWGDLGAGGIFGGGGGK